MKKLQFLTASAAFAALMLTACTDKMDFSQESVKDAAGIVEDNSIQFNTYLSGNTLSRAGQAGNINTNVLKGFKADGTAYDADNAKKFGFGVFAYYTGTKTYKNYTNWKEKVPSDGWEKTAKQTDKEANFMFNQQIWWDNTLSDAYITKWSYSPMKYWPNEIDKDPATNTPDDDQDNDASNNQAYGSGEYGGNLTFFAYAPYVQFPITGTSGITKINGKTALGEANQVKTDPIITYVVDKEGSKVVDLLWGTYGNTSANVTNNLTNKGVTFSDQSENPDYPYSYAILPHKNGAITDGYTLNADLTKQKTNGVVDFSFKHALAKVGGSINNTSSTTPSDVKNGLMIILDLDDQMGAETGGKKDATTKVTVKNIQIVARSLVENATGKPGQSTYSAEYLKTAEGDFNLATGQWNITGEKTTTLSQAQTTTYIINQDGTGTNVAGELNKDIKEPASWNSTWSSNMMKGVEETAKNVYETEAAPLVYIPSTYPELTVTVDYIVRTQDANLENGYSQVEQKITKKLTFENAVELNKQYSILIHLGLTSVKFTATVSDWEVNDQPDKNFDSDGNGTLDIHVEDVYVPINVGTKYSFTSYTAQTGGSEWAKGIAELTGKSKEISSETYKEVKVIYNNPYPEQIGKTYYMKGSVADGTTRYQLYTEDGTATGVWVAVSEFAGVTYKFNSYGSASETPVYSENGTARTTGNYKKFDSSYYQEIVVVTNPGYDSWVGKTFYVPANATTGSTYQLRDNDGTLVPVWVKVSAL
jgi:hypothetical protein